MKVSDYISQFRILSGDVQEPFLWSDAELAIYADHGYTELARKARCIPDRYTATGSRALCTIPLSTGVSEYALNKKILDIYSIKHVATSPLSSLTAPLGKTTESELDTYYINWWNVTDLYPKYYLLDRQVNKITVVPIPTFTSGTQLLKLIVTRLPLVSLLPYTEDNNLEPVDLREEWHVFLLDYIFHRAYTKDDVETRNDKKANEYLGKWLDKISEVKADMARRRRVDRAFAPPEGTL